MEAVFFKILDMSLTAGYVIAAILLIRLLLKKAPKKYSYALWLVAAFRLICPVSIESAFSLFNLRFSLGKTVGVTLRDVPQHSVSDYIPPAQNVTLTPPTVAPDIVPSPTPGFAENIPVVPSAPAVPAEPEAAITLMGVLTIIWCVGIAALLIYSVVTYVKLRRQMSTAVLLEGNVRQASGIRSPFILGFLRPQIYIPYHLSDAELSYVLAHERYHLKRRDHIIKPLAFLILALHWFNPLVWLAFHLMVKDMEMSCDEKVLSDNADIRKDYSSTLLSFAAGRAFPAPSPLSFGEGSVKSRIKNILNWKKPALWLTVAAIIVCIVVIAVCGTNPRILISMSDVSSVYAKGEAVSANAKAELITLINEHSKTIYRKAPDNVGFADSRAIINCADGSSYTVHYWYCSGFSFNPAHFGEDDYYTILSRLNAEGNVEKSWKMAYDFDAQFLSWLDVHSLANIYPFDGEFIVSENIFKRDNGVTLPIETAETIRLESGRAFYADSELLGTFEQWSIVENNWDNYLGGASGTWTAYNAKELRRNNFRAWRSVSGDRMYYLLLQEDGTLYLAGGYYDAEGEYDSESDDSNIFCIYELTDESSIRWRYVPYEHPDYFPLEFDFEYSSIRFIATSGCVRYLDANGAVSYNMDLVITESDTDIGWQPTPDIDMSVVSKQEMIWGRGDPDPELYFTSTLKNGETLSGTIVFSTPKENDRDLYEAALTSDSLSIKRDPNGGAIIYLGSPGSSTVTADVYAPVSCLYSAPYSSFYPWGGDSGCRYIINSDSFTVERMDGSSSETFTVDGWDLSNILSTTSEKWLGMFIGDAPNFGNMNVVLYQQISDKYFLLILDGQYHVGEMSGDYVEAIYAVVPEAQLGSAVWEYRPELSSRAPWFEFEFDMEYDNLQISTSVGTIFSDGSRYADTQLGLPAGSTVRWSPTAEHGRYSNTQLQFTINFADGSMIQGTIYISSEDNTLYTATLRANGLHLSNDEEYGHAVISLVDSSAVIGGTDHAALIADTLLDIFDFGDGLYITPHIADHGAQGEFYQNHRDSAKELAELIRSYQLTAIEMPPPEPSDYWIELTGTVPTRKITIWQGSSDTLSITSQGSTQYYRVDGEGMAAAIMQTYGNRAISFADGFTSNLDELLNKWQAEGVTELSPEKILLLNRNFLPYAMDENQVSYVNPLSGFFNCYYNSPEYIDLKAFLKYNFASSAGYTEADYNALMQIDPPPGQLYDSQSYEEAKGHGNPIHKFPRENIDAHLMKYSGITTADLTNQYLDDRGLVYLEEFDAYYNFTSDFGPGSYRVAAGEIVGDTAYLYYGYSTLTLRKSGDSWLIYSHTYDTESATRAYISNGILEIFDVGDKMTMTTYVNKSDKGTALSITDRETAERYSRMLQSCSFTEVEAPAQEPDVPRIEFTPSSPINRLIIWDSKTPLLRYSPQGHHKYYTFTSDVWDDLYDELYKSFDGHLQQEYLESRMVYATDLNELLNKWQAEGVTTLSSEQCQQLNRNFIPVAWNENGAGISSVNPLNNFFLCWYERPEDIDLAAFLRYNSHTETSVSEAEFNALKKEPSFLYTDVQSLSDLPVSLHKYPAQEVDALLKKYAGITLDKLSRKSTGNMIYLDRFDAYYVFSQGFDYGMFSCTSGEISGDTVYLREGFTTLTLRKSGDRWLIYSHTFDHAKNLNKQISAIPQSHFGYNDKLLITLYTADHGAHETITVTDPAVVQNLSAIMASYSYTELEMPYTEPSEFWIVLEPGVRVNKTTIWSGSTEMVQNSPRGEHSYYNVSTEGAGSLAWAVRRVYENLLLDHERIDGFSADTAEAAAELFSETVYGEHLMNIPAGGVYSIEYYRLIEHEVIEVSADGSAVLGRFVLSVWPEDYQRSGFWADNGTMGTGDEYGWILCTYEFVLKRGDDGLWHCTELGTSCANALP